MSELNQLETLRLNRRWRVETEQGNLTETFDTEDEAKRDCAARNKRATDLGVSARYVVVEKAS